MICRNGRYSELVHGRFLFVEHVDGVRLVGHHLADEPLLFVDQRKFSDQKSFRDGAAVDAVIDPDRVTGAQLVEQLIQALHVI